ncbi:NYN domain-containing protein [Pectinatus brassicae]|uniref:NYN domain-containing protein n=1 Tax=Pectinatus brassicae TaxID=862415 RepID=A0A840UNX9_9FIRM|nr:NYN domain-containing protein [Pectinatus brassicae]MBB5335912.1 hypothetical protein [Pectinatus brassicae]
MRKAPWAHLIVDGYNVINCWTELARMAFDLEHARDHLVQLLLEYGSYEHYDVTVVFDALYTSSKQSSDEINKHFTIVYTKKKETADSYIERLAYESVRDGRDVFVVTSDGAEQNAILGAGAYRMTVKELRRAVYKNKKHLRKNYDAKTDVSLHRNEVADRIDPLVLDKLNLLRKKNDNDL